MRDENIRKTDSLVTSAAQLQTDFRDAHGKYSDLTSDLAMVTKSELKPISHTLKEKYEINGIQEEVNEAFNKLENVLYDLEDISLDMDETVQTIGGMEFSTDNTVDKLSDILRNTKHQQIRMTKELEHLKNHFERMKYNENPEVEEFIDDINDFQLEFSRFQDYVQASVPRVSKLFDQLKEEEEKGIKFGRTNKI